MQLELALSDAAAAVPMLWEQLDPIARQAVIDRLARAIARAALPPAPVESSDE